MTIYTALGLCYALQVTGLPMLLPVLAAIGCYAMSLAPVTWSSSPKSFPIAFAARRCRWPSWPCGPPAFSSPIHFPLLNAALGAAGTFWLYAVICLPGGLFIWYTLPETKGQTLEEIERRLTAS
jgi:SP family sugar porter-like MFS transporter